VRLAHRLTCSTNRVSDRIHDKPCLRPHHRGRPPVQFWILCRLFTIHRRGGRGCSLRVGSLTVSSTCPKISEKSGNTHLPRAPCCGQWLARSQLVKPWDMAPHPTMMPQRQANERMKRSPDVAKRQSAKVAIWQGGGRQAGRRRAGSSTECLEHESQSMVCCAGTHAGEAACMPRSFLAERHLRRLLVLLFVLLVGLVAPYGRRRRPRVV